MVPSRKASLLKSVAAFTAKDWRRPHWRILYYHAVLPEQRESFARQLDWFSEHFRWCSLDEGVEALTTGQFAGPMLTLTFDDADVSLFEVVMPLLANRRIPACVYVVPEYVKRGESFRDEQPRPIMSWPQIREWLAAGHQVGSHSQTHAPLTRCSEERLRQEARWSRECLEEQLTIPIRHFAYPWGQHDAHTRQIVHEAGKYRSIATILRGAMQTGHPLFALRRDRGNPAQSPEQVVATMQLADRFYWLRKLRRRRSRVYWERHPDERFDAMQPPAAKGCGVG